jgi:hypothetical protein
MNINSNLFTQKPTKLNNAKFTLDFGTRDTKPARGRRGSDTVEFQGRSRSNSLNKGKGLPPELALERKAKAIHQHVQTVCDWLKADIEDKSVPLAGEPAELLAEALAHAPEEKRKANIENVFNDRSLKEGKQLLQQKEKEALESITSFPALAEVLVVEGHPEITISNIKAQLRATVYKYNEYIHAKQWLDRWDKIGTPTK